MQNIITKYESKIPYKNNDERNAFTLFNGDMTKLKLLDYLNDNFNIRMNEISHYIEYKRIDENEYKILNINDLSVELIKAEVTRNDRD